MFSDITFGELYPRYNVAIGVIKTHDGKEEVVVAGGEINCYSCKRDGCGPCRGDRSAITDIVEIYSAEKKRWKSGMSYVLLHILRMHLD